MKLNGLSEEQRSILRGLHFWRRNIIIARRDNDTLEIQKSDDAIKYAFERADKYDIPFSIQNKVLHHAENNREEGFSDMAINQVDKTREAKNLQHNFKVVSLENESVTDYEEIAKVVITNGISGKEYSSAVWAENRETNELFPGTVFLSNPHELNSNYNSDGDISDRLTENLYGTSVDDLIRDSDEVQKKITEYQENPDKSFSQSIPSNQLNIDLHSLVVDEEISEMLLKTEQNTLSKEDLVNFGQLIKDDDLKYELGFEFKEPFQKIINENTFEAGEIAAINSACKVLDVEPDLKALTITKEALQNIQEKNQSDLSNSDIQKVEPKQFLEKFEELNAIDNKILLNEDKEKGTISIGALVEKENLSSNEKHEFVNISNMEMSSFDYSSAIKEKAKESNELGNLHVPSMEYRSSRIADDKMVLTNSNIPLAEAKEFILENSQNEGVDIDKLEEFGRSKGADDLYYHAYTADADWYQLNYDLGTQDKYLKIEREGEPVDYTPSYDQNGEEMNSTYYDHVPENDVTFYKLNEKNLTFIDGDTNKEYPLDKVLSKEQLQNFKDSVDSKESVKMFFDVNTALSIERLVKEQEKPFSSNKSQENSKKNSKEEVDHER